MLMMSAPFDTRNRDGSWYAHAQTKIGSSNQLSIPEYNHPMIALA